MFFWMCHVSEPSRVDAGLLPYWSQEANHKVLHAISAMLEIAMEHHSPCFQGAANLQRDAVANDRTQVCLQKLQHALFLMLMIALHAYPS
jgi:hypothetical protein